MEQLQLPGVDTTDGRENPAAGQPACVLTGWIHEQLRDMQGNQVARLALLAARFESTVFGWDSAPLARTVVALRDHARQLHFEPLRRRGIFSLLGRSPARAEFGAQCAAVAEVAATLGTRATDVAAHDGTHGSLARRVLVEIELERQSLGTDLGRAVEWLEAMSQDMRQRSGDAAQAESMAALAARAESFAARLKRLHAVEDAAAAICTVGRNVIERRAALIERLRLHLDGFDKVWRPHVGSLAGGAAHAASHAYAGDPSPAELDAAHKVHIDLVGGTEDLHTACDALQLEERMLAVRLAAGAKSMR